MFLSPRSRDHGIYTKVWYNGQCHNEDVAPVSKENRQCMSQHVQIMIVEQAHKWLANFFFVKPNLQDKKDLE